MSNPQSESGSQKRELFLKALEKGNPQECAAFLDGACGQDTELRASVEALLRNHQDDSFLEQPAVTVEPERNPVIAPISEKPGDRIGRYKLLENVGEGGCGVVYVAEQEEPIRRRVALKVIKLGMDTKSVIARFEAERQALAMMDHSNIAKVFDAGATETGRPYFVMELVRGIRITDYCDQAKLSMAQRLELFTQVCSAIQHAHQKGVIHRDIKPSNILVTMHDGVPMPKVIDFGIAKATEGRLTDKTVYTELHQFIGTPAYMSPEQAMMSALDIDTRSDIYSLGVLLYELLTGRTPFDAKDLLQAGFDEMRRRIREEEPQRPSTRLSTLVNADLTTVANQRQAEAPALINLLRGDLDWIVMKALEKNRTRRYETANDLASDIHRHLNNEPVVARPPTRLYRLQKLVRRNKFGIAATASVFVAVLAGFSVATVMYFKAKNALNDLRKTAPAYIAQVHTLFAEQKVDEALAKLDFALRLVPDDADFHLLRANKLQALQRLPDAIGAYRRVLAIRPTDIAAGNNLRFSESLVRDVGTNLSAGARVTLYSAIKSQGRGEDLWPLQRVIGQEAEAARGLIEARLEPFVTQPAWKGSSFNTGKTRIAQLADGTFGVDLSRLTLSDLTPLRGLPITELFLFACQVTDLSPLAGMPLRRVVIGTTRVYDLRPLAEAPLESLVASGTPIEDLSPLRGKRLFLLNLNNTRVRDLSPLRGAPLETLLLTETPVESLEPLASMPLKRLGLHKCSKVKDLTPLAGLPLEELDLSDCLNVHDLSPLVRCTKLEKLLIPGHCRDLESLRRIPNLKRISDRSYSTDNYDWNNLPLADDFFRRLAAKIAQQDAVSPQLENLRAELRRMNLVEYRVNEVKFSADGTLEIDLAKLALSDLSPLAGLPVKKLLLGRTRVKDLTPLRGAPLEFIDLYQCPVIDLSPLTQCSNLVTLRIAATDVTDLTPVLHLPLEELTLDGTFVTDVSALADCKTLKRLILPRRAAGIEALRGHPKLERICFEWRWSIGFYQTTEEFWAEYDQAKSQR